MLQVNLSVAFAVDDPLEIRVWKAISAWLLFAVREVCKSVELGTPSMSNYEQLLGDSILRQIAADIAEIKKILGPTAGFRKQVCRETAEASLPQVFPYRQLFGWSGSKSSPQQLCPL